LANSMNSLRIEGQKTIAIELLQQFHWEVPDWVVIPGGNLGNVSALGKGFIEAKQMGLIDKLPRLAVAQAAQANPLYLSYLDGFRTFEPQTARDTLASAIKIGNPVSRERAIRTLQSFDGIVEEATEDELANACARADRNGLFTCPHTGVALAALEKMVAAGHIEPKSRVIVISTAHGLKFPDFKVKYHEDQLREFHVEPQHRNFPIEVEAEYEAVHRAVLEAIEQRTLATAGH
ncbi:MAG: pyridoxal-phosphate dependent enzyme, partial [Gemmatimonadetes bacterium]|nr:pyridoxal-phosphate dependent enzyme [Gemmatimonadota bacterium]